MADRSVWAREKSGPGDWIRFEGTDAEVVITGFDPATEVEWDDGTGSIREFETVAAEAPTITSIFIVLDEDETDTPITEATVGDVLRMVVQVTGNPAPTVSERAWERDGTPIGGATSATYTVIEDDVGEGFLAAYAKVTNGVSPDDDATSAAIDVVEEEGEWHPSSLFQSSEEGGAWDATDITKLYTDAGTTLTSAVDDPIHRVVDISGNGRHLNRHNSDGNRPLRKQNSTNYLLFDGADDQMRTADDMTMKVGWTMIVALRPLNTSGGGKGQFALQKSGTEYATAYRHGTSGQSTQLIHVSSLEIDNTAASGTSNDIPTNIDCVVRLTIGDGVMTTHRNGVQLITGENDLDGADAVAACYFSLGWGANTVANMHAYRAIAINRILDSEEIAAAEAWCAAGYAEIEE